MGEGRVSCMPVVAFRRATGYRPPGRGGLQPNGILTVNSKLCEVGFFEDHLGTPRLIPSLKSDHGCEQRGANRSVLYPSLDTTSLGNLDKYNKPARDCRSCCRSGSPPAGLSSVLRLRSQDNQRAKSCPACRCQLTSRP